MSDTGEVQPTRYDSVDTLRYRVAQQLGVTAASVVFYEGKMRPLHQVLMQRNESRSLTSLVSEFENAGTPLDKETIILAIYRTIPEGSITREVKAKFLAELQQFDDYKDVNVIEDLDVRYNRAKENEKIRLERDTRIAREVNQVLQMMEGSWLLPGYFVRTPMNVESSSRMFKPTLHSGVVVGVRNGQTIFNEVICSHHLPFIQYNNAASESSYKIFKGTDHTLTPNYRYTTSARSKRFKPNTIQMNLWVGDPNDESPSTFYTDSLDTFFSINFDLNICELVVDTPSGTAWDNVDTLGLVMRRLQAAMPSLNLGESIVVGVRGVVDIVPIYNTSAAPLPTTLEQSAKGNNFVLVPSILTHMMVHETTFSRQLYIEESGAPLPLKKNFNIRYRPLFSRLSKSSRIRGTHYTTVRFTPRMNYNMQKLQLQVLKDGDVSNVTLSPQYARLRIHINDAISVAEVDRCVENLLALFNLYQWGKLPNIERQMNSISPHIGSQIPRNTTFLALKAFYISALPESAPLFEVNAAPGTEDISTERKERERQRNRGIQLRQNYGNIFTEGYAASCGGDKQPLALTEEEARQYEETTYTRGGVQYYRESAPFPPPPSAPTFWFVCPSETFAVPNLVRNTGNNRSTFPFLPCCTMTRSEGDNYSIIYEGHIPEPQKIRTRLETGQLLTPGRHGKLPLALENLLQPIVGNEGELNHYGVDRSPSSLMHAVLLAVNDLSYATLLDGTGASREAYARQKREELLRYVHPSLLRQELPAIEDDAITAELTSHQIFMDPALHYRALEEVYNVNIFTFIPRGPQLTDIELEIPNFHHYHARPVRMYRPTILIYKYQGTESSKFRYPQCDLIIVRNYNEMWDRRIFEGAVTLFCHQMLQTLHQTITWSSEQCSGNTALVTRGKFRTTLQSGTTLQSSTTTAPLGEAAAAFPGIAKELCSNPALASGTIQEDECQFTLPIARLNYCNLYNIPFSLGSYTISQYVDANGKSQAFTLNYHRDTFTILVPPTQPGNLPHSENVLPAKLANALAILGTPTSVHYSERNVINGLWFQLHDHKHAIFCYITEVTDLNSYNKLLSLPRGPKPPMDINTSNIFETWHSDKLTTEMKLRRCITYRFGQLRKVISMIRQLIQWTFDIWRISGGSSQGNYRRDRDDDYITFADKYIRYDQDWSKDEDSLQYYDFGKMSNSLPTLDEITSISEAESIEVTLAAVRYIQQYAPSLVEGNLFIMYSTKFYNDMVDDLRRYAHASHNTPITLPLSLEDHYTSESDFHEAAGVQVILGSSELDIWLQGSTKLAPYIKIKRKIKLSDVNVLKPILYQGKDGKVYIVQNSIDGRLETCGAIASKWLRKNRNPGPVVRGLDTVTNYILYGIDTEGQLIVRQNKSTSAPYLRILEFRGSNDVESNTPARHAALLELL